MLFNQEGIELENWEVNLASSEPMVLSLFIKNMIAYNLSNSIFLDNTAGDEIAAFYESILDASISISTPNKVAASSSYKNYTQLKLLAQKRNVHFMYETNVGAGLPVISTLQDLINSGDEIIQIEGVSFWLFVLYFQLISFQHKIQ